MEDYIQKAVKIAGGQGRVGRALGVTRQAVEHWYKRAMPAEFIIKLCKLTDWRVTPHQINPTIYPNLRDGLPDQLREAKIILVPMGCSVEIKESHENKDAANID